METTEELKSKFSNVMIMYLFSIISGDITKCAHYLNAKEYNELLEVINHNKENNIIQMYDELNVKSIDIVSDIVENGVHTIDVLAHTLYMNYIIDADTKKFISGNNDVREAHTYAIKFVKSDDSKTLPCAVHCNNCGSNVEVQFKGKCDYCGNVVDISKYEYIITDLEIVD